MTNELLLPSVEERSVLWSELAAQAEAYIEDVESLPVAPNLNQADLHALLDTFSFDEPDSRIDVLRRFTRELKRHQVHTPHPCYFGLFNSAPSFTSWWFPQMIHWSGNAEPGMRAITS